MQPLSSALRKRTISTSDTTSTRRSVQKWINKSNKRVNFEKCEEILVKTSHSLAVCYKQLSTDVITLCFIAPMLPRLWDGRCCFNKEWCGFQWKHENSLSPDYSIWLSPSKAVKSKFIVPVYISMHVPEKSGNYKPPGLFLFTLSLHKRAEKCSQCFTSPSLLWLQSADVKGRVFCISAFLFMLSLCSNPTHTFCC